MRFKIAGRALAALLVVLVLVVSASAKPVGEVIGEYLGVPAFSNGENTGTNKGSDDYQCVALVRRYLEAQHPKVVLPRLGKDASAGKLFELAKQGAIPYMVPFDNSSEIPPEPGDIVCWEGHVAIAVSTTDFVSARGRYRVRVFEQNVSAETPFRDVELTYSKGYSIAPGKGLKPLGWIKLDDNAIQPQPKFTVMVVDGSAAMNGDQNPENLETLREVCSKLLRRLPVQSMFAMVSFGNSSLQFMPIETAALSRQTFANDFAKCYRSDGGANMGKGLLHAYNLLRAILQGDKDGHVILVSSHPTPSGDIAGMVKRYKDAGYAISTVAMGRNANWSLLSDIARQTGGGFYQVNGVNRDVVTTRILEDRALALVKR